MTANGEVVLEARKIAKSFPGVKAVDGVDLTLRVGRLTALLGENEVVFSSDLPVLMIVSGWIFVHCEGHAIMTSERVDATEEAIMHAALPGRTAKAC